jgi:hypothetical protein
MTTVSVSPAKARSDEVLVFLTEIELFFIEWKGIFENAIGKHPVPNESTFRLYGIGCAQQRHWIKQSMGVLNFQTSEGGVAIKLLNAILKTINSENITALEIADIPSRRVGYSAETAVQIRFDRCKEILAKIETLERYLHEGAEKTADIVAVGHA